MRTRLVPVVMGGLLAALGCSSTGDPVGVDLAEAGADILVDGGMDLAVDDVAAELPGEDTVVDVPDFGLPDEEAPDLEPACEPGEGCFLDPCSENGDCLSGWCVEHLGEAVCTQSCQEECPPGWTCKSVGGGGPDVAFICVSNVANLCKPCGANADCKSVGGQDDVCVAYGNDGSFCGGPCEANDDCPWGFSCGEALTVNGVSTLQCVAESGVCPCTDKSIDLALTTPCSVTNEFGTCTGQRVCAEEGLSDCDAATPAAETCNGIDDDCDGFVDEPDEVGGDFVNLCDDGNACTADTCAGEAGCEYESLTDTECIDGDSCTVGDHCEEGLCVGAPVVCDDNNPCTDNLCAETGGCEYPPNNAACDDGDPCTVNDQCSEGSCTGYQVACECQVDADCAALEDGDACNGTLYCDTGKLPYQCAVDPESVVLCPPPADGPDAICQQPLCDPETGTCSVVPDHEAYACDDGDPCTIGDVCQAGACTPGGALNCADDNPCTDDACDPEAGCVHTPNTAPCNDGSACTAGDMCANGECVGGDVVVCDDGNPCTTDSCDPATGCQFVPNDGACDDGNACTAGDHCSQGSCQFDELLVCDDDNACTTDSCDPSEGCLFSLNDKPCDDGDLCTQGDHCHLGECISAGTLNCDDGNPCTDDSCDPAVGCKHLANQAECDDLNACSAASVCQNKQCVATEMVLCADDNPCTDDTCDPATGCQFVPNTKACSDGDACTAGDLCMDGDCQPGEPLDCDDGNLCTDDSCDALLGCLHDVNILPCDDGNACTLGDQCANGSCQFNDILECDDDNLCTDDSCNPATGCVYDPNTVPCDDNDVCTTVDVCADGQCVGSGELGCDPVDWCAQNACVPACMTASCDPVTGCQFTPVPDCCGNGLVDGNETCDDGNLTPGDGCDDQCQSEGPPGPYYQLVQDPNPQTVFNDMAVTFRYPNNLTNGIWHKNSNLIIVGDYLEKGYWSHAANAGGYPATPNNGSTWYGRMVHMPGTRMVAYTNVPNSDGLGSANSNQLVLAHIDVQTGALSNAMTPQYSDGYNGTCNVLSSSVTDLYIYDGSSTIRRYATTENSPVLTLVESITLGSALPSNATCNGGHCYGGTFAWDGKYFYFAAHQTGSYHTDYLVYHPDGSYVATYNVTGGGGINGVYFDWSVGRYAIHDGYGYRQGGQVYTGSGGSSDSQVYGGISPYHSLVQ